MSVGKGIFSKYLNPVFIETGSGTGEGIQLALSAGFETIYSIELSKPLYDHCVDVFKDCSNIHLIHGDSRDVLKELLVKINEPITFWLDAHCSGGLTEGGSIIPILEEIEIIGKHPIKTHTVIIDDLRSWGIVLNGRFIEELSLINPNYTFIIEDGCISKDDILVAKVE